MSGRVHKKRTQLSLGPAVDALLRFARYNSTGHDTSIFTTPWAATQFLLAMPVPVQVHRTGLCRRRNSKIRLVETEQVLCTELLPR